MSLCYSSMFEIFQNKKVKRFYSPLNWMSLKTRKGVDLGVKLPWFTSRLFQLINLVILLLVPEFLAPVDQVWPLGAVTSLGRSRWELCTQILAPRKCSGETNFLTQACSSNLSFLSDI